MSVCWPPSAIAGAPQNLVTDPSFKLVSSLFDEILEIIFPIIPSADVSRQAPAVRAVLARSIDADGISRFILGRYGTSRVQTVASAPGARQGDGLLDFAATTVMRLAPRHTVISNPAGGGSQLARPQLAILAMTTKADRTKVLQSELVLTNGQRFPLTWEVVALPEGPRIEDVSFLGISIKLLLRSAIAEAAAEHPDQPHDLAHLLRTEQMFAQFPTSGHTP